MKAIVINNYGGPEVLEQKDVPTPAVEENKVLLRVCAAGINAGDIFSMRGDPWLARFSVGFPKPKDYIPGWDVAGVVEQVGKNVSGFQPGDEVFAACSSTFAEYVSAPASVLAPKPFNLTFEQAAAVPTAALTALQELRNTGQIQSGQKVLINGASGGVGSFAVQVAKAFGTEVTGVCSTRNLAMVRSLGADHVVDYTQENFTQSGQRYDLILDNVGSYSFADLRRALSPQGMIIPNTGHAGMGYVIKAALLALFMRQHGNMHLTHPNRADMLLLKGWIEAGKITPVIDKVYPLSDTPQAFRYLEEEHARGKVVLTVSG